MDITAEQILAALNKEPNRGKDAFLSPEDTAHHLHEYARAHADNMRQQITLAEVHRFAAAFGAHLYNTDVVRDVKLVQAIQERNEMLNKAHDTLWDMNQSDFEFFCQHLNKQAQQMFRKKRSLIALGELLCLDPWYVILRKDPS